MNTCLIISGGEYTPINAEIKYDYVIACDRGILNAKKLDITPDLIIGDFDSLKEPIPREYSHIPVNDYPIRKDDSDTMLATRIALDKGGKRIILTCALGGRLDHTYANIQTLGFIASNGAIGELYSHDTHVITHTGGELIVPKATNSSFSLFAFTDVCHDICIEGSGYDISHLDLNNTFPMGLSNYWNKDHITLTMKDGILLIIESMYTDL